MSCHKCLIYTRMLFYMVVIATHTGNGLVLLLSFPEEVLKIKALKDFHETQFFFFTTWNFVTQIGYAAFAFLCDWISLKNTEKKTILPELVTDFREKVFSVAIWPAALMVSSVFWTMYIYDRELLYPETFDTVISHTSNHIMHTMIVIFVVCELVLFPRRKPDSSAVRVACVVLYEALYVSALYYVHYTKNIWIYPIFATLNANPLYLVLFLSFIALNLIISYYLQYYVSNIVFKCRERIGERFYKYYYKK